MPNVEGLGFSRFHRKEYEVDYEIDWGNPPDLGINGEKIENLNIGKLRAGTVLSKQFILDIEADEGDVYFSGGTVDASTWTATNGFILGKDDSDSDREKFFIGNATDWMDWNVTTANKITITNADITGTLTAGSIHIPDINTTANSFHVESDGDTWWGCTQTNWTADNENAKAYIKSDGTWKFEGDGKLGDTSGEYLQFSATTKKFTIVQPEINQQLPPDENLLGYWSFDEGNGTSALDYSGNNGAGTITGASYVQGQSGTALDFNGSSDKVVVSDDSGVDLTGDMTICAWIKPTDISGYQEIVSKSATSNSGTQYELRLNNGIAEMVATSNGAHSAQKSGVTAGNWHFIVGTYTLSTKTLQVYVDTVAGTSAVMDDVKDTTTEDFAIGISKPSSPLFYFDGIIDEVRVYNKVLSQEEIIALYKNPGGVTEQGVKQLGGQYQSATTGALLRFDNTQFLLNDDSSTQVFKAYLSGTDVGDVDQGNYAGNQGTKYDKSEGTFSVLGDLRIAEEYTADGDIAQLDVCVQGSVASEANTQAPNNIGTITSQNLNDLFSTAIVQVLKVIQVSDDVYVAFVETGGAGAVTAVAMRHNGQRWLGGAEFSVGTISNSKPFDAIRLADNLFVASYGGGVNIEQNACTVSGLTITSQDTDNNAHVNYDDTWMLRLDDSHFAVTHSDGTAGITYLYSYAAGTLTEEDNDSVAAADYVKALVKITDSKFGLVYRDAGNNRFYFAVYSWTSTTITLGSSVILSSLATNDEPISASYLEDDKVIVSYYENATTPKVVIVTVSSTTPTQQTPVALGDSGDTPNYFGLVTVDTGNVLSAYNDGTTSFFKYLSISGNTITAGTEYDLQSGDTVGFPDYNFGNNFGIDFLICNYKKATTDPFVDASFYKADSKSIGIASSAISDTASGLIQNKGKITGLSGLTVGDVYRDKYDNRIIAVVKSTSIINIV